MPHLNQSDPSRNCDAFWLDDHTVWHVVKERDSKTHQLFAHSVKVETQSLNVLEGPFLIASFPTSIKPSSFNYVGGAARLVFSAYVYADGDLSTVNEQNEAHWDSWVGPKWSKLFTVQLARGSDGKWSLGTKYAAPLKDFKRDASVEPFGGLEDFAVSDAHILYTTKDPEMPVALHTKQNIYILDLLGRDSPREHGATHSPVISNDGTKVAWTEQDADGYESDRSKIAVYDLAQDVRYTLTQDWDRSAGDLAFTKDDKALLITAGEHAYVKLFTLELPQIPDASTTHPSFPVNFNATPRALTESHPVSGAHALPGGRILYTQSSFTSPNDVFLRAADGSVKQVTNFSEELLKWKDLDEGESFWFEGAEEKQVQVQGWALKPKGWKAGAKKSVPVVLLIHGGPQGAWEDRWSTRCNPNIFAQQGYFVVAINPTGSTSFGQEFTDAITEDWGGKPFVDLRAGWKFILDKYPEIDADWAVGAGASYGGFAINWIQGHPEYGFGFKALFCHDGVFDSAYNGFSTDELFFFNHDFGGPPWESKQITEKFSSSNYVANWSTPQLIVHVSKDYRLPDTEGIAAFHAIQQCVLSLLLL